MNTHTLQPYPDAYILILIVPMKKVILPEDIQEILETDKSFLNRSDIKIYTVATNAKALALHRAEKADLIIAKLDTQEMSGETLCSLIRNDNELCNVSIIIVSSDVESNLDRCLQCRANAFISIPINKAVLLQEVHHLLNITPRKSCRIPMSIKIHGTSKKLSFTGYAENISTSGLLFQSDASLSEGDTVMCSFSLPDSKHITSTAEIVRVLEKQTQYKTNCYGIQFIDLRNNLSAAIESFVEKECQHTL